MSDQAWSDKVLERVAQELDAAFEKWSRTNDPRSAKEVQAEVLQRELGPLLAAGQVMRGEEELGDPHFQNEFGKQMAAWDAAKKNLLGGTNGK
jgi:hypothetical protein